MYKLEEITDKSTWESFLLDTKTPTHPFFQSWNWGDVQQKLNHEIIRFGFFKDKKLIGVCLCVKVTARRGIYFHLRHGPILIDFISDFPKFLVEIKKVASQQNVSFLRMSPVLDATSFDNAY